MTDQPFVPVRGGRLYEDVVNQLTYAIAGSPRLARYSHELMEELAILLDGFDEQYTDYAHTVHIHQETLRALRSRDPARIAAVMDDHLSELEDK